MNQLVPANSETLAAPRCRDCGVPMRLFGIEAHPTVERTDLRTYTSATAATRCRRKAFLFSCIEGELLKENFHVNAFAADE